MIKIRLLTSLLALVLFLFMAHPCVSASGREMIVIFKSKQTDVSFEKIDGDLIIRKPRAFRIPAFFGGIFNDKEFVVLLCDARYNDFSDWTFIEPAVRTSYGDYNTWSDAEIVAKSTRKNEKFSVLGDLTAVMKGNKILVLAASGDKAYNNWFFAGANTGWDSLMIVGTVTKRPDSKGAAGVYVKWDKEFSLKDVLPKNLLSANGFQLIGGVGNGVVTKNGTIVFPIQIPNKRKKFASSIMYSTDDGSTWHIGETTEKGTSQCSVTKWGKDKLLLSTRYDGGYRMVYESDNMGATWKESAMFSGVWGNNQYRTSTGSQGSLITAPVDGEDVLLFSHPLNTEGEYTRDTLQMWMSDRRRIKCVGTISEDGKGERSGYSILAHVGENLYSAHEINPCIQCSNYKAAHDEWDRVIALSPLPDLFDSVKNTARAWRKVDAKLKNINVPTNGLVGFLAGGNKNDNAWEDEYKSVNAVVKGATPAEGGFRFDGTAGSGAQWSVRNQGQNQVYIFTELQFTLAATVKVHDIKRYGNHWLLVASEDEAGTKPLIGLGYTQDEGWYAAYSSGVLRNSSLSLDLDKEYQLAILYDHGDFDVYVDGVSILNRPERTYFKAHIMHFYIGGIVKSPRANGVLCTVKNVMLFNRVLKKSEIDEINIVDKYADQKESVPTTKPTDSLADRKPTAMMSRKETSDPDNHIIPFEDDDDESEESDSSDSESSADDPILDNNVCDENSNDVRHHSNDRYSNKGNKHADGAVGSISITAWMGLLYSAIVLAWL